MPVGKPADVERLARFIKDWGCEPDTTIWLQPLSQSPKATALCVDAATANGWRVSIQTHKYLGVR
jgi:7-carboxy-7-deazaguanine synthase